MTSADTVFSDSNEILRIEEPDFHHPYTPYDVQLQFMRTAYNVLERGDGQVGILESPTGTVSYLTRALSVVCHLLMDRRANLCL
jgi:chromosome transmission fidelity protein 1